MVEIRVHTEFPDDPSQLDTCHWAWIHCLTFPVATLLDLQLSNKPYKWIRYSTGVFIGAKGDLSRRKDDPRPDVDLLNLSVDALTTVTDLDLYYHICHEERMYMFPVDPDLANTRSITSTESNTSDNHSFKAKVTERDTDRCVVTNVEGIWCAAAPLIPHSKGDAVRISFLN